MNYFKCKLSNGRKFSFLYDPWYAEQAIVERFFGICVADSGVNRRIVRHLWRNGR